MARWIFPTLGVAVVAVAWLVPQQAWAQIMRHPVRSDGVEAAVRAAWAARLGWTLGALVLAALPWVLRDARADLAPPTRVSTRWLWISMLLAVALRFSASGQGLWYDEIASLVTYAVHGPGVIAGNAFTTANHPLQSLLSWCCLPLGVEPWVRLPSMLSGAAAVLGCWWIGRATREGPGLATAMAFTMAILPAAVNAGSEARGYGLMIAAASLSTGLLLMAIRHGGSWRWILCTLVLALGVWAHFVTAMVGAGHAAMALWQMRKRRHRVSAVGTLLMVACAGSLALALWSPALPDLLHTRSQFAVRRGDEPSLAGTQGLLLLWQMVGMTPLPMQLMEVDVARAVLSATLPGVLLVLGIMAAIRDPTLRRSLGFAGVGLPIAVCMAWLGGSWLYARFLLFATPATALLLAAGFQTVAHFSLRLRTAPAPETPTPRRPASPPGITIAALVASTFVAYDLAAGPRQPIREAVASVASLRAPQDQVLGVGIADDVVQWYALAHDMPVQPTGIGGQHLPEALQRADARWIVALYPGHRHANATPAKLEALGFRRRPIHGFAGWLDGGEGTVEVWERAPSGP